MIQIRPVSWLDAWKGEAAGFSGQQEDSMLAAKKWPCSSGTGEGGVLRNKIRVLQVVKKV